MTTETVDKIIADAEARARSDSAAVLSEGMKSAERAAELAERSGDSVKAIFEEQGSLMFDGTATRVPLGRRSLLILLQAYGRTIGNSADPENFDPGQMEAGALITSIRSMLVYAEALKALEEADVLRLEEMAGGVAPATKGH